jgi:hypothetical protein
MKPVRKYIPTVNAATKLQILSKKKRDEYINARIKLEEKAQILEKLELESEELVVEDALIDNGVPTFSEASGSSVSMSAVVESMVQSETSDIEDGDNQPQLDASK